MAISFIKLPKTRQFNYKPLFYDARKEELEKLKRPSVSNGEYDEAAMRDRIQMRWKRNRVAKDKQFTKIRFILILLALAVITYLLLK